jgi:uncharacterized damage-inducible protein DinB
MDHDLRYPVGKFSRPAALSAEDRAAAIAAIEALPAAMQAAVAGLSNEQLETPYRPEGWTVRQTVHHVADSHMQAMSRIRMALTEEWPVICPYDEAAWAELEDARRSPLELSLQILDGVHKRWTTILRSLTDAQWLRGYQHPQSGRQTLEQVAALYAWHGRHHTAHITGLRQRMGW